MQNYNNHTRYFPFQHFLIMPLTLIYLIWTIVNFVRSIISGAGISIQIYHLIGALILLLLPMLARIYALKNQDRIIRMEMRQRYFELTGKPFRDQEKKLRLSQIIALRFASDVELLPLIEKTIEEDLRSKEIKKSIKNWQEDRRRV